MKMCEAQKFACDAYLGAPNWGLIRKRRIAIIDSIFYEANNRSEDFNGRGRSK